MNESYYTKYRVLNLGVHSLNLSIEHTLQLKTSKALYNKYRDCVDGIIGFIDIALSLHTPDFIVLSHEQQCDDIYTLAVFEVKTSVKWENIGQLLRYRLYAPTYVVVPKHEIEKLLTQKYTLLQTLKEIGIGLAAIDTYAEKIEIKEKSNMNLSNNVHWLYDAILWQIFKELLKIPISDFQRTYETVKEFLKREAERKIHVDKFPNRFIVKAIINAMSARKMALPLAENPLIFEVLESDFIKLSAIEFMKWMLQSKPFVKLASYVLNIVNGYNEADPGRCYVPPNLLLLYTKGLPLQFIKQTYDDVCQRIYNDLFDLYSSIIEYLARE